MQQKVSVFLMLLTISIKSGASDYCGKIFTERDFVLKSENYPQPYPQYPSCFYLIKGDLCTEFFEFEFKDFDIKKSVGCTEERLEIGAQDAICGHQNKTKLYKAEGGQLKLKFVSSRVEDRDFDNRGFKIYVKRVECPSNSIGTEDTTHVDSSDVTDEAAFEWTTSAVATTIPTPTYFDKDLRQCCNQNTINAKKFVIVSPNFPYSVNFPEECAYIISKNSPDICRLRIHLKFFYLGQPTPNSCPYGHLEIDGKFICGCNSNINLISNFGYSNSKVINFKTFGIPLQNSYSGYLLEVIQDKCPMKYTPDNRYLPPVQFRSFRSYEDRANRIGWPNKNRRINLLNEASERNNNLRKVRNKRSSFGKIDSENENRFFPANAEIQRAKLISERSYVQHGSPNELSNDFANIFKQVYYFAPEEDDANIDIDQIPNHNSVPESSNYIETSKIDTLLTNLYEYEKCCKWNQMQFLAVRSQYGNTLGNSCRAPEKDRKFESDERCIVLNEVAGNFRSPNYPFGYPAGLNICYRFENIPGYCEIKLFFEDFHLESSRDCLKDYLQLSGSGYRYCGSYLSKTTSILNSRERGRDSTLTFVSDFTNNGRGFSVFYDQIPCIRKSRGNTLENGVMSVYPGNDPTDRNSNLLKRVPNGNNDSAHKSNPIGCDRAIQLETFIWRNGEISGNQECQVRIGKVNESVCKLNLHFEEFNLDCHTEYMLVDGTKYCGNLTGKIVNVNMGEEGIILAYKTIPGHTRESKNDIGMFRILGRQISDDCDQVIPILSNIPEIQRRMDIIGRSDEANRKDSDLSNNNEFGVIRRKDICEVIHNSTNAEVAGDDKKIPGKICDLLKSHHNATECSVTMERDSVDNISDFRNLVTIRRPTVDGDNGYIVMKIIC